MNVRIRELVIQAADYASQQEPTDYIAANVFTFEKFAELIVKECADVAKEKQVFVGYDVSTAIKKHFGVE